ncbi:MAG: endonuclease/exonuclease/phosphatase family protein [Alphaproteobacteria bacterium]
MFRKFFKAIISLAAAFTGFFILFSFLAPWYPMADSVAHFRFHLTAILVLTAILLAVVRDWRFVGVSLAVSAAGIAGMAPAFPAWGGAGADDGAPVITIVQLNLSFRNAMPEAVADFIRREQADIVTLQEVSGKSGRVIDILADDYPFRVLCPAGRVGGLAVLSRLPMAPDQSAGCAERGGLAWMRVMAGGQPVTVASLHLHWPYPFGQERHIDRLEDNLRELPRPVLLGGDFNAAPWSYAVDRVARATGATVAGGLRFSFDIRLRNWTPAISLPIDHILLPDGLALLDVRLGPGPGSDHRSIVARFAMPRGGGELRTQASLPREGANVN